ncbi:MAG: putative metal-dependent hydrolase [Acidobacteriia bacterium]|nr:putative metal-dependent hydrolase [Terriglobia bacterium]
MSLEDLQYPIGRFDWQVVPTPEKRNEWLAVIAATPEKLREAVAGLDAVQLDTSYRDGGWTVRQVVHHYADDHLNSYVRFKWALTEDNPTIKGYLQAEWAEIPDAREGPIAPSLDLLDALHLRWVAAWRALDEAQWKRGFVHPVRGFVSLEHLAALYAWHGEHHVTQVLRLREREKWNR